MELRDYLRLVRRHWWVMATSVILAIGVAFVVNVVTKPVYAASMTFFISVPIKDPKEAANGALFAQARLRTYADLLTGDRIAKSLAANARIGLSATEIQERIAVTTSLDSVLIQVTVTDGRPARAELLADQLSGQFTALVSALETTPGQSTPLASVQPIEPPQLEEDPVSPRPLYNTALAAAIGLLVGAGIAVLRELTDYSVRTAGQLEALSEIPVLGEIPLDPAGLRAGGPFLSAGLSPRSEALRRLRTNVQYADREHPVKTLVVTSPSGGEGRSATACGLAVLFAEAGQRVLLVDAELRRPRLAAFLGREGTAGLTTVLLGSATLDQALQQWGTGLWLLASGHRPANPSELLGSPRMAELLEELKSRFDMVIVDAPPLLPVADGAVVAARADGALLLVRSRKTTASQVTGSLKTLRAVDARLLGCVFTMSGGPGPLKRVVRPLPPPPAPPSPPSPPQQRWWNTSIAPVVT